MSTGTITEAKLAPEEERLVDWGQGPFHRWHVVIDAEGKTIKTGILRKPESPDPTNAPAETYTDKKGNLRWRVMSQGGGKGGGGKSPEEQKRIQRQHSQEMALRALAASEKLGVPGIAVGAKDGDSYRALIKKWTDWFEADIAA